MSDFPEEIDLESLFQESLQAMENAFRRLEALVPAPQWTTVATGPTLRFVERLPEQALIQKLARQVSGLHAIRTLLDKGLGQEQCVIQRTLDEIGEDIQFLAMAIVSGEPTDLHERYLADFWAEEFDKPDAMGSTQKRGMVRRQKIRAYIARTSGLEDPSTAEVAGHTISKAYSGYVHAASPQVMDMCGEDPPRFHVSGLRETPRFAEHRADAWNYFYRGLLATTMVAKALGDAQLVDALYRYIPRFEERSGTEFFGKGRA